MSAIAPDIFPFLVAALEDERRELHRRRQLQVLAVVIATIIVRRYVGHYSFVGKKNHNFCFRLSSNYECCSII